MKTLDILIVDDDVDFAESLAEALEPHGYDVTLAFSGEEAVNTFRQQNFDLTFMDVKMPGMNGVESFLEFRKIRPQARVVMMTAYSVENLLAQAVDHGAMAILHKPVVVDELLDTVEKVKPYGVILVADDDEDFAAIMREVLEECGYTVLLAHDGQQALDCVLAGNIDILLLDMHMPLLSGIEVYLELKKQHKAVPTIIVTAYAKEEVRSISLLESLSIRGCISKPFDPEELINSIENIRSEKRVFDASN